ncbi:Uncharacterized conserved protein YlxW, UPF0749 family [Dethiosulfatibacter aminovorans DSM 17477]|uniref:Uncharacterized conserved protein YlxW, UPF0749 family n=1 Tax=Dethiosulfatibacter aminovorans DSM 17477 TaxID=1121476 RepID=A0A1M6DKH5_9FIRM|nr:DUF881 domain-containing protein [Dethiosulfatibacter aminovorans]SHI73814.1 Uncharacterized conserved protein YlxW, UPF0749 family [Dethiosulfatibacter aminovorans DSM 17477]
MKKGLAVLILSLTIGLLLGTQIVNESKDFVFININTVAGLSTEVEIINQDIEDIKNIIERSRNELAEYEMLESNGEDISVYLNDEIDKMKAIAGYTNLRGEGIMVKLSDNMEESHGNINYDLIHDMDVTIIINDLINAGAEAVSINGKRILSNTEVVCIGPLIRVNGEGIAAPFIIKAIGNKDELSAAINAPNTYAYNLKTVYGIGIETMKSNFILIPKYTEKIEFDYIEN